MIICIWLKWYLLAWFFLIGVGFTLLYAIIFVFYVYNWFVLRTKAQHRIISELIYILGLEPAQPRTGGEGSEDPIPIAVPAKAESVESVYGFGHDDDKKWTYAGKKPKAAKDPALPSAPESSKEVPSIVSKDKSSGIGTDVSPPPGTEVDQLG